MEIMAGQEAKAKAGLRPAEKKIYSRYIQMTPGEREIELHRLKNQYISLKPVAAVV